MKTAIVTLTALALSAAHAAEPVKRTEVSGPTRDAGIQALQQPQAAKAAEYKSRNAPQSRSSLRETVIPVPQPPPVARTIDYKPRDIVEVRARLRFSTMIVLPEKEKILDFTTGDREFWIIEGVNNLAYVKPAKLGASTNLNLVTASGNIYSFLLDEVSETANAEPDLKVYVTLRDEGMRTATAETPKFVPAAEVDELRLQLARAKEEQLKIKSATEGEIERAKATFMANMRFPYSFEAGKRPFNLRAMAHDGRFTYIQARPEETPTVYEVRDGKPNMVNFSYRDGMYVVSKVLSRGYLAIGKKKTKFQVEE